MKQSGFSRKAPPRPPATQCTYQPRPRAVAVAAAPTGLATPAPKFAYVRDERFQLMCRGMECQRCWAGGPDAGVTWAHSNQGVHGHGRSIKASDQFVAALCWRCHGELDQGRAWDQAEKVAVWDLAYRATVARAVLDGTWPAGVDVPRLS